MKPESDWKSAHHLCVAALVFAVLLSACKWSESKPNEKEMSAAEGEIYEAVIRHITTPVNRPNAVWQLAFDDTLLSELKPGGDVESCKQNTRKAFRLEPEPPPPYNSLADKAYRFFTRSDDVALHDETVKNFLERSCTSGLLSRTFRTDLPRTFLSAKDVHFEGWAIQKDEPKSFRQLYPGAGGIIAFSHAGLDSTLDEAIVSTSFVCGGSCAAGYRYILQKKSGRWEVVSGLIVWEGVPHRRGQASD